ncbi:MAG: radical SAM protein [Bacteroidales bacterium]|nr:radical SAM protein [Bacteroidales bacterium]MBN2820182.1 radical SAM protein [Bacteroidales bacterium]
MKLSKHNIISRIADSDKYFIINPLYKEADILNRKEYDKLYHPEAIQNQDLINRGYISDPVEENRLYKQKYLEFLDARDTDEVQLFFVPTYMCNFACSYCYQDEYSAKPKTVEKALIDSFFNYISNTFNNRRKYITLFGGEPLLNTPGQRDFLEYFFGKTNHYKLDIALVTNGYHLEEYIDLLKTTRIREVQVTLDGTKQVHDKRRMLKGGTSTFERIVNGIDLCLKNNLSVNLRMVLDKENINNLPELSEFAIKKGWTSNPLFKTQLGRNYELHHCQSNASRLYSRVEMYKDIYELLKTNPEIKEFHKPSFSISKFLFEEGVMPDPLFDSCPGTKTEWAFDYTGQIYSCTATVGKPGEELGTFYPDVFLKEDIISEWEVRDVLSIPECENCELQLACGGGCASVAKNNNGRILSPDCRPVKELLELGIAHYFDVLNAENLS